MTEEKPNYHTRLSRAYSADLSERGILTITGPACEQQLLPDEAWNLLQWLADNHRDRLYHLMRKAEEEKRV